MKVFVTVGTTQFDKLFHRLSKSDIQLSLKSKGYTEIILQTGTSKVFGPGKKLKIQLTYYLVFINADLIF